MGLEYPGNGQMENEILFRIVSLAPEDPALDNRKSVAGSVDDHRLESLGDPFPDLIGRNHLARLRSSRLTISSSSSRNAGTIINGR